MTLSREAASDSDWVAVAVPFRTSAARLLQVVVKRIVPIVDCVFYVCCEYCVADDRSEAEPGDAEVDAA